MPDPSTTLKLIVLSGRSGSGKSSTAYEICHLLKSRNIAHTHIDGDNLDAFYPRTGTPDLMLRNLKLMWSTYWAHFKVNCGNTEKGQLLVVILSGAAIILNSEGIMNAFTAVVNDELSVAAEIRPVNIEVSPIVLEAGDRVVEKRLRIREIGGELKEHIVSSRKMDGVLSEVQHDHIKRFVNDSGDIKDLALEILKHVNIDF